MTNLDHFVDMMTGHFHNKEQFDKMKKERKLYPYAEHLNTICNGKILNLPKDFTQGPRPAGPRIAPAPSGRRHV